MGNNKWMYYLAYGVLVVGAIVALILSEKPLSATVVNLALFSFNMAAVILVMPTVLNFMARMKEKNDRAEADIMLQLKEIKARILILANATQKAGTTLPLKNALEGTAMATDLKASQLAQPAEPPTQTSSNAYGQAALRSVQNAAPVTPTHSANAQPRSSTSSLSSMDNIFSNPRATVIHKPAAVAPTPPPMATANAQEAALEQPTLFSPSGEPTPEAQAPQTETVLIVKAHVEEDDVLCLRGEGPGLNWQEGLPMNYTGNDEWRWSVQGIAQPITCRIYLNDEISAFGDDIVLEPGRAQEVSPSFPKVDA